MMRVFLSVLLVASVSLADEPWIDDVLRKYARLAETSKPNEPLPRYKRSDSLKGTIRIVGSSTVGMLVEGLVKPLSALYPELKLVRESAGSSTAIKALVAGTADLGALSRPMTKAERDAFKKKFSYWPTPILFAVDALTIVVNRKNPIKGLTLRQIDSLFSANQKRGGPRVITWRDLGIGGEWASRRPRLYGFSAKSGSHAWMRKGALMGGKFSATVHEEPGSGAVVNACGAYPDAIAYVSRFYKTRRTRIVPISESKDKPFTLPTRDACLSGTYPLRRGLFFYVNKPPKKELPVHVAEFLSFVTSAAGQRVVEQAGSYPVNAGIARYNLKAIGR